MDDSWLDSRITATKAQIEALETAITALSSGTADSWTLDTGQTRQVVTKRNMSAITASLNAAYNLLATLEARRNGAALQGRPRW